MKMTWQQFSYVVMLTVCLAVQPAAASIVEVTEDTETNEPTISVVSSLPETTYQGKLGYSSTGWSQRASLQRQYAAGEEFCYYAPVLGMRNFSCSLLLAKYWDIDTELIVKNSEGGIIQSVNFTVVGKRSPYAFVRYNDIPRPDILQICVRNSGSTKTIYMSVHLSRDADMEDFGKKFQNLTATHNVTAEAIGRLENRFSEILTSTKNDYTFILQDYYRLLAIARWVDARCLVCSVLMIFSGCVSTVVIRRWFGSPRSSI